MKTIEEMLEQYDSYDLTDHLSIGRRTNKKWYIYFDSFELHRYGDIALALKQFDTAIAARTYLLTQSGVQAVEAAERKLEAKANA